MGRIAGFFIGPLAGPIFGGIVALLIGALVAQWLVMSTKLSDLRDEKTAAEAQLAETNKSIGACHTNVTTLSAGFDGMRSDINKLADDTKKNDDELKRNMAGARAASLRAAAAGEKFLTAPRLAPTGINPESCTVAARILKGTLP